MEEYVWLDLDGTIADNEHRMQDYHDKEWLSFYDKTKYDKPILPIVKVIQALDKLGVPIFVCTARPEHNFSETSDWLITNKIPFDRLVMRKDKDHRPDTWAKYDMLMHLKKEGYWPLVAFDDRNRIVKMLRDQGVKVLHVADGDY